MGNSPAYDVAIAGGGMAGATLALALDQAGFRVCLIDGAAPDRQIMADFDGRASAIAYTSMRQWRALGLADELQSAAQPISRIVVTDGPAPGAGAGAYWPVRLEISTTDIADADADEPLGWMVENRRIRMALQTALAGSGVTLMAPAVVTGGRPGPGGGTLDLADGRSVHARLLVSAEGRGSALRTAAGIRTRVQAYGQTGVVTTVALARPHDGAAFQHFLPSGPLAILPLTGDRASLVWTERTERASALLAAPVEAFEALLARRFGDGLGRPRVIGERFGYPLSQLSAEACYAPGLALVGDAAHGVHPIAGQGLNLGLKDVAVLTEVLSEAAELGEDIACPVVLERYARWRRLDVASGAAAADLFARVFSNDHDLIRLGRGLAVNLVNASGRVRGLLAKEAGGATGDLPRLLWPV